MAKVLNQYKDTIPDDAVWCMRPSKWSNPFRATPWGIYSRDEAVDRFEQEKLPKLLHMITELTGKDLVCCCAPLRCHCDSLLKAANG